VELLVVLSIVSILSVLATAGFQNILGTVEDGQVSDISNTLVRARAYAMANNTYTFVGIQEVSAAKPSNGTQASGTGRIAVVVMASSDGTRGYPTSISGSTVLTALNVVSPLREYENLHLLASAGAGISNLPNTPAATAGATYEAANTTALTAFNWPVGTTSSQYPTFGSNGTVIQFDPQGEAQIVTGANTDAILQWIEIDLEPTHGTTLTTKNPATILIDGASGSVTTYRE
jgi:type II secretory pathway pseudopilin PulG